MIWDCKARFDVETSFGFYFFVDQWIWRMSSGASVAFVHNKPNCKNIHQCCSLCNAWIFLLSIFQERYSIEDLDLWHFETLSLCCKLADNLALIFHCLATKLPPSALGNASSFSFLSFVMMLTMCSLFWLVFAHQCNISEL